MEALATRPPLEQVHPSPGVARRRALFEEAVAAIESGYAEERLSVAEVARRIFTSKRQLQRAFGEAGTSFQETLHAVRMERSAELLVESSLSVGTIARRVGYRQPTQFAKAFRRHYRLAPTELRRLACDCACETPRRLSRVETRRAELHAAA